MFKYISLLRQLYYLLVILAWNSLMSMEYLKKGKGHTLPYQICRRQLSRFLRFDISHNLNLSDCDIFWSVIPSPKKKKQSNSQLYSLLRICLSYCLTHQSHDSVSQKQTTLIILVDVDLISLLNWAINWFCN